MQRVRLIEPLVPERALARHRAPEHRLAGVRVGPVRAVVVGRASDRDAHATVALRRQHLGCDVDPRSTLATGRDGGEILPQRALDGAVRVEVVGVHQLAASRFCRVQDRAADRRQQLRPLGIAGVYAVVDDRRPRRGGHSGFRQRRIDTNPFRSRDPRAAAADGAHPPTAPDQLLGDGTPDAARRAEDHVQRRPCRAVRLVLTHHMLLVQIDLGISPLLHVHVSSFI
jgi:hypothetical protein